LAKISIVGAGPGSEDYVTPIARRTVQNADVIVGADRALTLFADDIRHETMKLTAKTMKDALRQAVELAKKGKSVAILSTGDPGFSGLLKTFLKFNKGKDFEIEVIPGISSVQVCAARLGMPWDNVELFTFHEGATAKEKKNLAKAVETGRTVMLLPDAMDFSPSDVAKSLLKRGVGETTPAFVCENLTLDDEKISKSTLGEVSKSVFGSLCVMVIKPSLQQ
jgi:cobalt-precorrin-7 (C5)-methyltransferase